MRVSVQVEYISDLLKVAIEAGFDWVFYASQTYVRLSVIPDGKSVNTHTHYCPIHIHVT